MNILENYPAGRFLLTFIAGILSCLLILTYAHNLTGVEIISVGKLYDYEKQQQSLEDTKKELEEKKEIIDRNKKIITTQKNDLAENITKKDAFEMLFESGWQVAPYSDNVKLPCYKYQGKWELYEENSYFLTVKNDPFIYYKPVSVTAYMWCQPSVEETDTKKGIKNGYMLKGIELLKNSVHEAKTEIGKDKAADLNDENRIGMMSGLFLDEITFNLESKPIRRDGERIGRHRYKPTKISNNENEIINYIKMLRPNDCLVSVVEENATESYKDKDGETQQRLIEDKYRIQFNCKHKDSGEEYIKQLIFRGKVSLKNP